MDIFIIIVAIAFLVIWVFLRGSKINNIESDDWGIPQPVDKNLRAINTYFFTSNKFDFEKFCDYVLCINENMSLNDVANCILELDLLLKCSGDLNDRIISVLLYSEAITNLDYKGFDKLKERIRNKEFEGTYQDLVNIYFSAIFYLKHQLAIKRITIDSYIE